MKALGVWLGRGLLRVMTLVCLLGLAACEQDGVSLYDPDGEDVGNPGPEPRPRPQACTQSKRNNAIYEDMKDRYFWYKHIPSNVNVNAYDDPRDLLDALLYHERDRWSFLLTAEQGDDFAEGTGTDYGINLLVDQNAIRVSFVHPLSNAKKLGLARGDTLIAINGKSVPRGAGVDEEDLDRAYRELYSDKTAELTLLGKGSAPDRTLTVSMVTLESTAVTQSSVINAAFGKVGYLLYTEFTPRSEKALETAFAKFKKANVSELVLDLRYNGGGSVDTSRLLASYIGGRLTDNKVYTQLLYNDKHDDWNREHRFYHPSSSLGLNRVMVLTSDNTASASEWVINGLKPFIDVVLVGGDTHGKPVGMNPVSLCDVVLIAINFEGVNANGDGRFYNGIPANCAADDDLDHSLGDTREAMLDAALAYLQTGRCTAPSNAVAHAPGVGRGAVATWRRFMY
jgi:carboxyl-terminal processing protease